MGILEKLIGELAGRYFLIPLQVAHDSQIQSHSKFVKVEEFIEEVMRSFAEFAPPDTLLVIKQHPLERGHKQYSSWIDRLTKELDLSKRVLYIHDQHLPTLLSCARGVVVINSTVGLSAIHHGIPLKNLGEAIYDIPGLTYQGELNDFWSQAPKPMQNLYESFYNRVIKNTQINGNFYRRLPIQKYRSGVRW
jgi:capsular polysaccharide export protein